MIVTHTDEAARRRHGRHARLPPVSASFDNHFLFSTEGFLFWRRDRSAVSPIITSADRPFFRHAGSLAGTTIHLSINTAAIGDHLAGMQWWLR
ncbi:hypothetical protein [Jiangella asiatica]|uniref:Uncharacterized protein n=1 Tax=Jiangella asiatica TaxID=2530372 RepID=A0A4R5DLR6_9ACTN|nr:hypothetical protein [Jiangella asiatica]TDE12994.1 hypothetical protein E1269_06245 [Jiangella asiatica]